MKKAVVFDLDGTLNDTLPTIAYYANTALHVCGVTAEDVGIDRFRYFVGDGAVMLCRRMLAYLGIDADENPALFEQVYQTYMRSYDEEPLYLTKPYDGITELVDALKSRRVRCAVLSNKPQYAAEAVVRHFFGERFDIVCGARPEIPLKPAPDMLLGILRVWECEPSDALMVGDTSVDVRTGQAAGVETVGVLWGFRPREELVKAGTSYLAVTANDVLNYL